MSGTIRASTWSGLAALGLAVLGLALLAGMADCRGLRAQDPPPAPVPPAPPVRPEIDKATQALIDEFLAAMPREPVQLRDAAARKLLAPKALPILRRIRAFAAEHAGSVLAQRVHEFTLYAALLGEPGLGEALAERGKGGDREAEAIWRSAAVIAADDGPARAGAIAACASALREKAAADAPALDPVVASCAVQCLAIAAALSVDEAQALAASGVAEPFAERFRQLAAAAARDPARLVGKPFDLAGTLVGGEAFRLSSLRGKVVVVDFWATWCAPCKKALPGVVALKRELSEQGLAVVGISCDRTGEDLRTFLAAHPDVDWPQLFAGGDGGWHPLATEFGVTSIPRVFLVDRKGILRSVDARTDLREQVLRYLRE